MHALEDALALLGEDGVDEVIIRSGQPVRTVKGLQEGAVVGSALTASEIVGLLLKAQLSDLVPKQDTAGEVRTASVRGRPYEFRIARFLDLLEVRVTLPDAPERDAPTKGKREETVVVTAPSKSNRPQRASIRAGRAIARDLPPPSPLPIGSDDPTIPIRVRTLDDDARSVPRPPPSQRADPDRPPSPPPAASVRAPSPAPAAVPQPPAPRPAAPPRHRPTAAAPLATAASPGLVSSDETTLDDAIADVLARARAAGASDVHLLSDQPPRARVAGKLVPEGDPIDAARLRSAVDRLLPAARRDELLTRGYVDLGLTHPRAGRLRLNINRHRRGIKLCARIVAPGPATLADLGLPWEVEAIANHHQGLVVCSGPSGMGKTSTMAALVQLFNERKAVHIITVEDPVEIEFPVAKAVVSQREVGSHTLSFASALKGSLREDPDIIAIGELRDRETVEMALTAAETGHLVLATMSTPSGAQTIDRLIDMFPPEDQNQVRATLAGALKLVVSQRLIETIDGTRQVAAFEVITGNVPLWSLIRDRKLHQLPSLLQRGRAYGMVRLDDSLRALMLSNQISRQAAMANATDPKLLGPDDGHPAGPASQRTSGRNL